MKDLNFYLQFLSYLGILTWSFHWKEGLSLRYFSLNQEALLKWRSESCPMKISQKKLGRKIKAFNSALRKKRAKEGQSRG